MTATSPSVCRPITHALAVAAFIVMSGCSLRLNEQIGLRGADLPALDAARASHIVGQPSVTVRHDRSHWRRVSVLVPLQQVEHHPPYVHEFVLEPTTHRATGRFPTVNTALETEHQTAERAIESPLNIIHAGVLLVWAPLDMVIGSRWPWTVERASVSRYQRIAATDHEEQLQRWFDVDDDT